MRSGSSIRNNDGGYRGVWSALAILTLAVAARTVWPALDPPRFLAPDFITDEGWWIHNARYRLLVGDWFYDDFNQAIFGTPLFCGLIFVSFKLMGIGLAATRWVPILAGTLLLPLVWFGVRRETDGRTAIGTLLFLGLGLQAIGYSRVALVEPLTALLILGFILLWRLGRQSLWLTGASGIVFGLAVLSKTNAVYYALLVLVLWWLDHVRQSSPGGLARAWTFAGGAALSYGLPFVLFFVPRWDEFLFTQRWLAQVYTARSLQLLAGNLMEFGHHRFFQKIPIVASICLMALTVVPLQRPRLRAPRWLVQVSTAWILLGMATTAMLRYQPERRFVLFLPALCIIAAVALRRRTSEREVNPDGPPLWLAVGAWYLLVSSWLTLQRTIRGGLEGLWPHAASSLYVLDGRLAALLFVAGALLAGYLKFRPWTPGRDRRLWNLALIALFGWPLHLLGGQLIEWLIAFDLLPERFHRVHLLATVPLVTLGLLWAIFHRGDLRSRALALLTDRRLAVTAVIAFLAINTAPLAWRFARPSFSQQQASRSIATHVDGQVVLGRYADSLSFENRSIPVNSRPHYGLNPDPLTRFDPAFFIKAHRYEDRVSDHIPDYLNHARLERVQQLDLCPSEFTGRDRFVLELYRIE